MSPQKVKVNISISPDQKTATVRMGSRRPIVCGILGVDRAPDGSVQNVYLDRKIHQKDVRYTGTRLHGAITTICTPDST